MLGRDERRSIGQLRPGLVRYARIGLGQDLPGHGHAVVRGQAREGALGVEGSQWLRLVPGQRSAEGAAAPAQGHGDEIVGLSCEPRAREAHQHAAILDEFLQPVVIGARADVEVRQHHDRGFLVEQRHDWVGAAAAHLAHVGIGCERPGEVEGG